MRVCSLRDYVTWTGDDEGTSTLALTWPSYLSSQPPVQHWALVVVSVTVRHVCELVNWLKSSTWRYCDICVYCKLHRECLCNTEGCSNSNGLYYIVFTIYYVDDLCIWLCDVSVKWFILIESVVCCWLYCMIIVLIWVIIRHMIVMLIIVQSNVILCYCITFDFRIRREGCKNHVWYCCVRPSGP